MLKHYRVDYGPQIDTDGAQRSVGSGRTAAFVAIAVMAVISFGLLVRFAG
jgi:hypothetical protein